MLSYAVLVACFVLLVILIDRWRPHIPANPCLHSHNNILLAVHPIGLKASEGLAMAIPDQQTVALFRCQNCGNHSSHIFVGGWTRQEFLGEDESISVAEMKRMFGGGL